MVCKFGLVRRMIPPLVWMFAGLPAVFAEPAPATAPASAGWRAIPASDARFRYEGRFDRTDPAGPVVIWEGSRILIDFTGDRLRLDFDGFDGQNFFDVHVDGAQAILAVPPGLGQQLTCPLPLSAGHHRLMLFKRSEASAGTARFRGIELAADADAAAPAAPSYRHAFEFIGDSITAGACDEDGPADQWDDRRTHDNALAYGALAAAALDADYRCIAVSGMGVSIGWVPFRAGEIWDRVYPRPGSLMAALASWRPDVVFVNLGENDDSYPRAHHLPFPADYTPKYVALVRAIRAAYPAAEIVLLRGGMWGGANSPELRTAWTAAVAQLEASDPHVAHFVFQHWTNLHPRVADHRALADELIAWLKTQPFMRTRVEAPRQ